MPSRKEQLFRQLRILRKIQVNPSLTAKDISEELEVSVRTIYRDIKDLTESNFPIFFDNGYKLPENYFFPSVNFDMEELIALFLSSNFLLRQKDLPYSRPLQSALEKIEAKVQPEYRKILHDLESKFAIGIPEGVYEEASYEIMCLINKAIFERSSIEIRYHTFSDDTVRLRTLNPYGIFFSQDNWYLVAYCHLRNEVRDFNIKRIKEAKILQEEFSLPPDFNISHYVSHNWDYGEAGPLCVRIHHSPQDARRIRETQWHPSQSIEEQKDGSLILTVNVRAPENMIPWILGRKSEATVLDPEILRKAICDEIVRMAGQYGQERNFLRKPAGAHIASNNYHD